MRQKAEVNGGDDEPTLTAATKNLGDRVEIRIRDNGTGIPPEVKEKMFNPFFTTKPAGEERGWAYRSAMTSSSSNMVGLLRSIRSPANSPSSGSFCRAAVFLAELGRRVILTPVQIPTRSPLGLWWAPLRCWCANDFIGHEHPGCEARHLFPFQTGYL